MTNNDTTTTLIQRRFGKIVVEFALDGDDLEFAEALWTDLLHRASPNGDTIRAGDLPLLEEALFWALASRNYQSRIAREGFVPNMDGTGVSNLGGAGSPNMGGAGVPARGVGAHPPTSSSSSSNNPNHTDTAPLKSSSSSPTKNNGGKTSDYEHEKNSPTKTRNRNPSLASGSSLAKILTHPLTEPYAKAGERYRKLIKEIEVRAEKARKTASDEDDDTVDIAAAFLPLLKRTDGLIEEALRESAQREKELGLI